MELAVKNIDTKWCHVKKLKSMDQLFVTEKKGLGLAPLLRTSCESVPHLFYETRTARALLVVKKRGQLNLAKDTKNITFCKVNSLNNNYSISMLKR